MTVTELVLSVAVVMPVGLKGKGVALMVLLLAHAVLSSPLVKRDLSQIAQTAIVEGEPAVQVSLTVKVIPPTKISRGSLCFPCVQTLQSNIAHISPVSFYFLRLLNTSTAKHRVTRLMISSPLNQM